MRLDRYLKVARLIKRRSVAKEVVDDGNVLVNGRTAKPATDIDVGDELEINLGRHHFGAKVVKVMENPGIEEAETMYEITFEEKIEDKRS